MTPPEVCLNCHGNAYTTDFSGPHESTGPCVPAANGEPTRLNCLEPLGPDWFRRDPVIREHWRRFWEELVRSDSWMTHLPEVPFRPVTSAEEVGPCPAEARWPEWLRTPHPEGFSRVWWVRGNYEALREDPTPFRVDVERASVRAEIDLRSDAALPLVRGWVDLLAGGNPHVSAALDVEHNQLDLLLARLLNFQDVLVDWTGGEFPLNRISTGDFGGLHVLATVPNWLMFFVQPFMVPSPPPGYDQQTFAQFANTASYYGWLDRCWAPSAAYEQEGVCPHPMTYPDRRGDNSLLDLNLLALLPESLRCRLGALVDEDGRLPQFFNLEDFLAALRDMPGRSCPPGGGGGMTGDEILNFIRSGSMEIRLEELNDFFLPGVLDLGPSRGLLRAYYDEDRRLDVAVEDFEIEMEAMGYGGSRCAGPEASLNPGVQLHWASLTPGEERSFDPFLEDEIPPPGIRVSYDLPGGRLRVGANLRIHGEITLPAVGPAFFEADVTAIVNAERDEDGRLRMVAGGNRIRVENLTLHQHNQEDPLLDGFTVELRDGPDPSAGRYVLEGRVMGRALSLAGALELPIDPSGHYDGSSWEETWGTAGDFHFRRSAREEIAGDFALTSTRAEDNGINLPNSRSYGLNFDAERRARGTSDLIRGGRLEWNRLRESECQEQDQITLTADLFRWGELALNGLLFRVIAEEIFISPEESRFRISDLTAAVNGAGPSSGPVRGEVRIEQASDRDLAFTWTGPERRLTMEGLDVAISAQRLHVLPDALLRSLNPRVAAVGIDGRLSGGLEMFFPSNPRCIHGEGELLLSGDRDGDIYYVDGSGRRVGAPLFRNTHWRFSELNWINTARGYGLGRFRLDTIVNLSAAPNFSAPVFFSESPWISDDLRAGGLGPYEIASLMVYNNQPILPAHFHNRIDDYLMNIFLSPGSAFSSTSLRLPRECRETEGGSR